MGLKGSFEGMGTLWPFSKVSSFLFCSPPHWRHIWLLKKGGWNCVFGLDLFLNLGGGGSSHQKSVAACLSPPPHKVCPQDSLLYCAYSSSSGPLNFAFGPAEHSFWVYLGKPELDFPLIQVCFGSFFSLVGWGKCSLLVPSTTQGPLNLPPPTPDY